MTAQPEIQAIPDTCEFRMMVHLLRVKGDPAHEAECLIEILERESANERLAFLIEGPAGRDFHLTPPLKCRCCRSSWAAKESSMATQVLDESTATGFAN